MIKEITMQDETIEILKELKRLIKINSSKEFRWLRFRIDEYIDKILMIDCTVLSKTVALEMFIQILETYPVHKIIYAIGIPEWEQREIDILKKILTTELVEIKKMLFME
jgi:hypothetical protein